MPADLKSAVLKAVENALKQSLAPSQPAPAPEPKKPILSTGKAMLLGAGLATAGGGLISSRGRELVGSLRDRKEQTADGDEDHEEPEAEEDDDSEDEDYDEPEAEARADDVADDEEEEPEERPRRGRRASSAN